MAYIQEKVKGKKIVSFKFKACMGRDANGKQIFKCKTWYPPADLTPAKARKEAQKVAGVWEEEAKQAYLKEQEEKAVAGELPPPAPVYTFDSFVNEVWIPLCGMAPTAPLLWQCTPTFSKSSSHSSREFPLLKSPVFASLNTFVGSAMSTASLTASRWQRSPSSTTTMY